MDVLNTLLWCVLVTVIAAQGGDTTTQKIESFHVVSDIRYRFATTQIVSVVRNTAEEDQEIAFSVTLPKEAFIMHFAMSIDGKVYEGEVKEKKAAKRQYQEAVDRGQSAGHVAQDARHANLFDVSVNVASQSAVNFTLTYQELLRRKLGLYHHEIHVNPGEPVEDFLVKVFVKDKANITLIRTPQIKKDYLISNEAEEGITEFVSVLQRDPKSAYIEYAPTLSAQGSDGLNARFLLQYDVEHYGTTGQLMVVDGYFVNFYAPAVPPMPKDIVFVLDKSGSMMGRKMEQLKTAMKSILKDLMPDDRFNIISFSSNTYKWKPSLLQAESDVKAEAVQFVNSIGAVGGTNINDALLLAVRSLQKREIKTRAPIVFFLTDGQATTGVTSSDQIQANVMSANEGVVPIVSLAFGNDADYDLMKAISAQNSGFARKIYQASDSALQVANLYKEISAVALRNLKMTFLEESVDEFTVTQQDFPVVFNGSEIVICGRLDEPAGLFKMEIDAVQKDGDLSLKFETENVENFIIYEPQEDSHIIFDSPRDFGSIVERMWAFLTIKQLLKEREKGTGNETVRDELKQNIIDMAVKYKFVTPLTSMVVTKPDKKGQPRKNVETDVRDVDDVTSRRNPSMLSSSYVRTAARKAHSRPAMRPSYALPPPTMLDLNPLRSRGVGLQGEGAVHSAKLVPHSRGLLDSDRSGSRRRRPGIRRGNSGQGRTQRKRKNNRGRGRQPGKSKPGRKTANKRGKGKRGGQPKMFLSRIIVEASQNSLCVVPRKWKPGNYSLMERPSQSPSHSKQYPVLLEIVKAKKRGIRLSSLYLDDGTWVKLNASVGSKSNVWAYGQGRDTTVSVVKSGMALQLDKSGHTVVKLEFSKRTKRAWFLSVTLSDTLGDGAAKFKKIIRKSKIKKNAKACVGTDETFSEMLTVNGRKTRRFYVN